MTRRPGASVPQGAGARLSGPQGASATRNAQASLSPAGPSDRLPGLVLRSSAGSSAFGG